LQVTFRNLPPSTAIETLVRQKAAKLELFSERIMGCRVLIEAPHRRRHKGKLYHVRIDLTTPGSEIVINREPSLRAPQASGYCPAPPRHFKI
jgi:hypothetical protein